MENEMDLSIARFIRELDGNERKDKEERERLRKQYDPRERITYTLEEMMRDTKRTTVSLYIVAGV